MTAQTLRQALLATIIATTLPGQTWADNHALVMGVSDYSTSPLPGVRKDLMTARSLAQLMGVPAENIVMRRDQELTLKGLRQSLKDFDRRIKAGDRVFIYYSGHGTSYSQDKSGGQCQKALVTQEIGLMPREEFHALLQPIIDRAAKTFVFLDTCFSGGVVGARAIGREAGSTMRPKFTAMAADDPCAKASNYTSRHGRDFEAEAKSQPNYYLLGSAGPNEYAIDGGLTDGGLATSAFFECVQASTDKDGDGVITLQEARSCAQTQLNQRIRPPFSAQTLTEGNGPGGNTPVAFVAGGGVATITPAIAQPAAPVVATNGNPEQRIDSMALLETIRQGADGKRQVTLRPTRQQFKIGSDFLEMDIQSSKAGYLTLFSVGSSGKIFQLFPNRHDHNNRIEAGNTLRLPRESWRIRARGPAGTDRFLAVVSDTPNRFANLGLPAGPFTQMENKAASARNLILSLIAPAGACAHANQESSRDFADKASDCATAYGAGLMEVQEVD